MTECTMYFCNEGLSLIRINKTINESLLKVTQEIDRSTVEGDIEYLSIKEIDDYECLKLDSQTFRDLGTVKCMYICFSKDKIIKRIIIDISDLSYSAVKEVLIKNYGSPELGSVHEVNGAATQSYMWIFKKLYTMDILYLRGNNVMETFQ